MKAHKMATGKEHEYWRTLIRVERIDQEHQKLHVVVPGWNPHKIVKVGFETLDPLVLQFIQLNVKAHGVCRLHAEATIGEDKLRFRAWSIL